MCNDFIQQCDLPRVAGDTYEITIKEGDKLIVTVETKHLKVNPKTTIAPVGIAIERHESGQVYHKVDWSVKPAEKEYYD